MHKTPHANVLSVSVRLGSGWLPLRTQTPAGMGSGMERWRDTLYRKINDHGEGQRDSQSESLSLLRRAFAECGFGECGGGIGWAKFGHCPFDGAPCVCVSVRVVWCSGGGVWTIDGVLAGST